MNNSPGLNDSDVNQPTLTSKVADAIDLYVPPFLMVVGLVCNILVILVMRTSFFSHISTSLYITVNAFIDNISLTMALPVHWIHVNFPEVIYRGNSSDVICKAINFIGWSSSDLGIVLTTAMTFERAFAIKNPLKAPSYCTIEKAKYVIISLFFFVLLKDGFLLIKSDMVDIDVGSHLCTYGDGDDSFQYFVEKIFPVIHNIVLILAFLVISVSNVIIITSVKRSGTLPSYRSPTGSDIRRKGNNVNGVIRRSRRPSTSKGRQLTIMLISDSLTIVICTLPFAIFTAIQPYISGMSDATTHLVFAITFYLLYVNRCVNFFLYCTSGEKFRLALKSLCMNREERRMSVFAVQIGAPSGLSFSRRMSDSTERQNLSQSLSETKESE